jgi:hypothetical protein
MPSSCAGGIGLGTAARRPEAGYYHKAQKKERVLGGTFGVEVRIVDVERCRRSGRGGFFVLFSSFCFFQVHTPFLGHQFAGCLFCAPR